MKWRVALAMAGSSRHTDYRTIEADTKEDAERIAKQNPRVLAVKWVAEPDPDRERS